MLLGKLIPTFPPNSPKNLPSPNSCIHLPVPEPCQPILSPIILFGGKGENEEAKAKNWVSLVGGPSV